MPTLDFGRGRRSVILKEADILEIVRDIVVCERKLVESEYFKRIISWPRFAKMRSFRMTKRVNSKYDNNYDRVCAILSPIEFQSTWLS